jgi:hypothetical protein
MRMTREFYRPNEVEGCTDLKVRHIEDVPGSEIWTYGDDKGQVYAAVFGGKRAKPDWHYHFVRFNGSSPEEQREKRIKEWIENQRERAEATRKRRKEANKGHTLKVGDVLSASWGYDQTNVNFFQVVEVPSKCYVVVRGIASLTVRDEGPSTYVRPVKDAFLADDRGGKAKRYKAGPNNSISWENYANAYQTSWDAEHYETGWGWGH